MINAMKIKYVQDRMPSSNARQPKYCHVLYGYKFSNVSLIMNN